MRTHFYLESTVKDSFPIEWSIKSIHFMRDSSCTLTGHLSWCICMLSDILYMWQRICLTWLDRNREIQQIRTEKTKLQRLVLKQTGEIKQLPVKSTLQSDMNRIPEAFNCQQPTIAEQVENSKCRWRGEEGGSPRSRNNWVIFLLSKTCIETFKHRRIGWSNDKRKTSVESTHWM